LPGALVQVRRALRPDGLFLGALTGGRTLGELREALYAAETEISGGASPRVLPAAEVRDIGGLLQRAGFALPVTDRDVLTVRYNSAFDLFRDLRAMGATNVLIERERKPATRRLFSRVAESTRSGSAMPMGGFGLPSRSFTCPAGRRMRASRNRRAAGSGQISLADVLGRKTE
jgi:hypothetical protein